MKVHNFFKKNISFLVVFAFCYAVMPQVQAQNPNRYRIYKDNGGGGEVFIHAYYWLQDAVSRVATEDNDGGSGLKGEPYIIYATENDDDVTGVGSPNYNIVQSESSPINIPDGMLLTLTSQGGSPFTIKQPNDARHISLYGDLTLKNIILEGLGYPANHSYSLDNGGISVEEDGKLRVTTGAIVQKCHGGYGGGVSAGGNSCTLIMDGGEITNNTSWEAGGGVVAYNFTMTGGEISYNTTLSSGGGMCSLGETILSGGVIHHNKAIVGGGVCTQLGRITITGDVVIRDNCAAVGGGVSAHSQAGLLTDFYMDNGTISNNHAVIGGGADIGMIGSVLGDMVFTMEGGVITSNASDLNGTILSEILENYARYLAKFSYHLDYNEPTDLAAFLAIVGVSDISEFTLRNLMDASGLGNDYYCDDIGGGVWVGKWGKFIMNAGSITNNHASINGGGIYTEDFNNLTVALGSVFSGNTADKAFRLELSDDGDAYNPGIPITAGALKALNLVPNNVINPSNISLSASPSGIPFLYAYNNYDINYILQPEDIKIIIDTVCFTTDSIPLSVKVVNGGKNPMYQWILNGNIIADNNDSIFKYKSSGRDTIRCKVYADTACGNDVYSQIMVIEMLPKPTLSQPDNINICAEKTIEPIVFSGTYDYVHWEVTTGNGMTIGMLSNSGTGDISAFTAINSGEITIKATPMYGECEGESKTFTITVAPKVKPKATIRVK